MNELRQIIESAWDNREQLSETSVQDAIRKVIDLLDSGSLRVAEPLNEGWQVNEWVKKAVVLYFPIQKMETLEVGIFEYHDKIPLKRGYKEKGIRVVPHAVARHGAYISKGTILMPSFEGLVDILTCFLPEDGTEHVEIPVVIIPKRTRFVTSPLRPSLSHRWGFGRCRDIDARSSFEEI